ncbi:MAG TPA: helix-turn-helix domain-containing protein [Allosphingosinicella sp.]|nr:helix-turn-helix domain-containing protein [Allosphingosinicella sp.]
MATSFAQSNVAPAVPEGAIPFLLAKPKLQGRQDFAAALQAAAVAESASHDVRRNTRCRISYLLCELANQLRQQDSKFDCAAELPLSRFDIAEALDVSLCKVKRVLALLSLSGVITTDGRSIQVLDWRRLCTVANVDPARLSPTTDEDDDPILATPDRDRRAANLVTASGEPACFV